MNVKKTARSENFKMRIGHPRQRSKEMISLNAFSNFYREALRKTALSKEMGQNFAMNLVVDLITLLKNIRRTPKIVWENV